MSLRSPIVSACIVALGLAVLGISAQTAPPQKGTPPMHASGPFEVKVAAQNDDKAGDPSVNRFSLDKIYHGDLEATSKGQMLTASTEVKGSGAYVAIERVGGTLRTPAGVRKGSFTLQHMGTMTQGVPTLA